MASPFRINAFFKFASLQNKNIDEIFDLFIIYSIIISKRAQILWYPVFYVKNVNMYYIWIMIIIFKYAKESGIG